MVSTSSACSPVTGPITDTATYTYSDLDGGFSPPKSCLEQAYTSLPVGYDTLYTWVDTFTTGGHNSTSTRWLKAYRGRDPACFPSHYPKACEWLGTVQQQQNYIYSPATCPGGYASATSRVDESEPATTTATCCPSGYALSTVRVNIGETFWGDPVTCTSIGSSVVVDQTTTTFSPDVLTLYAPTVVVAWQSTDLARWKTALPSSTSTGTGSLSEPTNAPGGGLSTGAKAGIGVGCAVVAIVALAGLLLFFRRRSQRKRRDAIETILIAPKKEEPPLPIKKKGKQDKHTELADEAALQEMTSDGRRLEADDKGIRAELP